MFGNSLTWAKIGVHEFAGHRRHTFWAGVILDSLDIPPSLSMPVMTQYQPYSGDNADLDALILEIDEKNAWLCAEA